MITLKNEHLAVVLSEEGGTIESIVNQANGAEHYWQYDAQLWPRRTSVCFPVCGALLDGEYRYEGKTYAMPQHGFLREMTLAVIEQSDTKVRMAAQDNETTRAIYPFAFRFELTHELRGNSMIISYRVSNTGDKDLYYSTGSHYTYAIPLLEGETHKEYRFCFDGVQKAGKKLLENGNIVGESGDIFHGASELPFSGLFDEGGVSLHLADLTSPVIRIAGKSSAASTQVAMEGFSNCVLWSKPGACPFTCIEAWAGMFERQDHDKDITRKAGIEVLKAQESRTYTQTITIG